MTVSCRLGPMLLAMLICVVLSLWPAHQAQAQAVACSVTSQSSVLSFGNVDLNSGTSSTTSAPVVSYSCVNNGGGQVRSATICLSILNGSGGTSNSSPRVMLNGSNSLKFQLYQDAGRSIVWGPTSGGGFQPYIIKVPSLDPKGVPKSGSVTLYGAMTLLQTGLPPGSYTNAFTGADAFATYASNNDPTSPTDCTGGSPAGQFPFTVSANVVNSCVVTANSLDFGTLAGFLTANVDAASTLQVTCPLGTAYQIGLDNGKNASGTTRRMTGGSSEFLTYEIYSDSNRSLRWGNTQGTDALNGTPGTGSAQNYTVYGRVPSQSTPSPSTYTDTITVNVFY